MPCSKGAGTEAMCAMKNRQLWQPSKYVLTRGKLCASRDLKHVSAISRLITDLIAAQYDAHLKQHCRGNLLDLGCGKAPLYLLYQHLATSITCVDWGASPHDVSHADLLCDLNEPIPLDNDSFDTIILSDVLEHIYRPQQLLSEVARMLRPGGKLILNVPFMYWLHEQPHDYYRYTRFALERMVQEAGLSVALLSEIGGAREVLVDVFSKTVTRVPLIGTTLARSAQWITPRRRSVDPNTMSHFARQLPLGYFMVAESLNAAERLVP
jgi:SAM-dependent methyltransferase